MQARILTAALLLLTDSSLGIAQAPDQLSNGLLEIGARQAMSPEPLRLRGAPPPKPLWHGLIEVTLKNISGWPVHIVDTELDWEVTALDSLGKPVPMREEGKQLVAAQRSPPIVSGPVSVFDLPPGREITGQIHLNRLFQMEPGRAYTIKIKRSRGLPTLDRAGFPLMSRGELRCTLEIPAQ